MQTFSPISNASQNPEKQAYLKESAALTADFLAKGGKIQYIPYGVTAYDELGGKKLPPRVFNTSRKSTP